MGRDSDRRTLGTAQQVTHLHSSTSRTCPIMFFASGSATFAHSANVARPSCRKLTLGRYRVMAKPPGFQIANQDQIVRRASHATYHPPYATWRALYVLQISQLPPFFNMVERSEVILRVLSVSSLSSLSQPPSLLSFQTTLLLLKKPTHMYITLPCSAASA